MSTSSGGPGGDPPTATRAPSNGPGIAALILGILALLSCWLPVIGLIFAILAIVLGVMGRGRAARGRATNRGSATAGLVLGVLSLIVNVIVSVLALLGAYAIFSSGGGGLIQQAQQCIQAQLASGAGIGQARQACQLQIENQVGSPLGR